MKLIVWMAVVGLGWAAEGIERLDGKRLSEAAVDRIVVGRMRAAGVTGLGVAVLNGNTVSLVKAYGQRGAGAPLATDTVMYGASFTKSAFAYLVMQLVDEGKIDLDRPVVQYLGKPWAAYEKWKELGDDPRAASITGRMLLTHSAGFANFRMYNPDGKLKIFFPPGERYAYSGEGINLLGFVVEEVMGEGVGELMQKRVFDRFGMRRTSMTWREDFAENLALGHDETGKALGHNRRGAARAAGSMDTTVADWGRFMQGVMRGEGISAAAKAEMLKTQIRIRTRAQFPTLTQPEVADYDGIQLGYGLGWGTFQTPYGAAFFKEGHDDGWENHTVCFAAKGTCLILMSNSSNGDRIFMDLLGELVGDRFTPAQWEGYGAASRR